MEAGSACPVVLLYSTQGWPALEDRFVRESVMEQPCSTADETTTMEAIQYAGCRGSNGCLIHQMALPERKFYLPVFIPRDLGLLLRHTLD